MPATVAGIALPEGHPEAIFDAARELHSIAAAFEGGAGVVSSGVEQVGSWQGQASDSFRALAGSYEDAARSSAAVLQEMAASVRAYGRDFREAYERIKRLKEEAEECVREIELWEARRDDAAGRESAARTRAALAMLSSPLDMSGAGLAAQSDALAEAGAAAYERAAAERRIGELRDRLEHLRREGEQERERALHAERRAAGQVLAAAGGFPAVGMPGGAASGAGPAGLTPAMSMVPAVYRGGARSDFAVYRGGAQARFADFSIQDILGFSRDVDREMGPVDEAINEGVETAGNVGRELSGINDAERSWDAFGRGDIFGGLFYGALASPFGKWGKPVKEGAEFIGRGADGAIARKADELDATRGTPSGGGHGQLNPYPSLAPGERWTPSDGVPVLGRLDDTSVARNWPGHSVLDLPNWTIDKNREWIQSIVDQRGRVYVGSPLEHNLWNHARNEPTVFAQELQQLREAGYRRVGDYLEPPP
jgi:uncharacterized protein YukE